jgi:hypothetical protein
VGTEEALMGFNASMKGENEALASQYIDWLLQPRELRTTQREFALAIGVSEQTLRNWRKEPAFQRELTAKARGYVKAYALPDIIDALHDTAISKGPQQVAAAKLLMDFMEKGGVTPTTDLSKLSTEEIRELLAAALGKLGSE